MLGDLAQDLRFALRSLRKSPSFTLLAVAALAIGIGANATIFGVVDTVLLRPLPYPDGDRLVMLWATDSRLSEGTMPVTPADYADWRAQAHSFAGFAAGADAAYNITGGGDPEMIIGYSWAPEIFPLLGLRPEVGRTFTADDGEHVVVMGDGLWRRRFGADPSIVGKTITLDQASYTVVGVMPATHQYPSDFDVWTPLVVSPQAAHSRERTFLRIVGRLAPGVTIEQARAELAGIGQRLAAAYPDTNHHRGATVVSVRDMGVADIRPTLLVLLGAVGLVLLLVCNNLASLVLARSEARAREIAVRAALGATRRRILRQLLTESLVLSVVSGVLGLLLALWGVGLLVHVFPQKIGNLAIPRIDHIPIDARLIAFTFLASAVTGILFGIAPALAASRPDLERALREGSPQASGRGTRVRRLLVAGEIALALVLAAGAGLLARSFQRVAAQDLGFAPHGVLTARAILPDTRYATPAQQRQFVADVLVRLRALPGVQAVGAVSTIPLSRWWSDTGYTIEGRTGDEIKSAFNVVDPGYFAAMRIPLLRGRGFADADREGAPEVCIVDQLLATRYFPGEDAVGRRLNFGTTTEPKWRQIVGVVGDIKQFGPTETPRTTVYVPFSQRAWPLLGFVIRTGGDPLQLAGAVRSAVWSIDGDQPISYVMTVDDLLADTLAPLRVTLAALAAFAALALALAALGVYGVMAFAVAQRRREIGIRVALGAQRRDVARMVLGQALGVALAGVGVGLALALALGRLLASLLFQVGASDPLTFCGVAALMTVVAMVGAWLPARAATRVDPMTALRSD
jgi:putative ABC transport system permease protein